MNPTLTHRDLRPEMMDDPGLDAAEHARALRGLGRINRVSLSAGISWPPISRLAERGPVRVLDLASGGGDVPIALAKRAARSKRPVAVDGCDVSPEAVRFASSQAKARGADVRFFGFDALRDEIPAGYDVVTCSLFLHHLGDTQAVDLLRRMAAAARLVVVNDLERSRLGYALAWAGCRVLSRSPVVRHDGPASVAGAFTRLEARGLAERAGLEGATVKPRWPCRFLLEWSRA
jgi:2-polyprenyl-3-methyl-5-hydroxy-6-metoxy-1,4-benzoquinol methylase